MFIIVLNGTATTITSDADFEGVVAAYRALPDAKSKAAVRKTIDGTMRDALTDMDMPVAMLANQLGKLLTTAKPSTPDVNPVEVLIDAVAELELAVWLLKSSMATPAGLEFPESFDIETVEFLTVDEFTGDLSKKVGDERARSIDAGARAFASAKRSRSAERSNHESTILSAFDGLESGAFLTVSEIANKAGGASTGAIAARLFPTSTDKKTGVVSPRECTVKGIRPGTGGPRNSKGAYLI